MYITFSYRIQIICIMFNIKYLQNNMLKSLIKKSVRLLSFICFIALISQSLHILDLIANYNRLYTNHLTTVLSAQVSVLLLSHN